MGSEMCIRDSIATLSTNTFALSPNFPISRIRSAPPAFEMSPMLDVRYNTYPYGIAKFSNIRGVMFSIGFRIFSMLNKEDPYRKACEIKLIIMTLRKKDFRTKVNMLNISTAAVD